MRSVERLADLLSRDICLEIARWKLTLGDAHLDKTVATELLAAPQPITEAGLETILAQVMVPIGDGSQQLALGLFLSPRSRRAILEILKDLD